MTVLILSASWDTYSGGTTDLLQKGFSTYVLTDAGVSATATVALIRVQPYSIE